VARGAHHVGQEAFGQFVAVENAVFRAFLVIDDEFTATFAPPGQRACGGVAP
jgi:hypothetical protein